MKSFKEFTNKGINEGSFEESLKLIDEINIIINKAIKDKDKKTLDIMTKQLNTILKDF